MQTDKREMVAEMTAYHAMAADRCRRLAAATLDGSKLEMRTLLEFHERSAQFLEALANEPPLPGREAIAQIVAERMNLTDSEMIAALTTLIPAQPRTEQVEAIPPINYAEAMHIAGPKGNRPQAEWEAEVLGIIDGWEAARAKLLANGGERIPIHGGGEALDGYRAAVSYISADSWDGCPDCIEILRAARSLDTEWDWAGNPDHIAQELRRVRTQAALSIPDHDCRDQVGEGE